MASSYRTNDESSESGEISDDDVVVKKLITEDNISAPSDSTEWSNPLLKTSNSSTSTVKIGKRTVNNVWGNLLQQRSLDSTLQKFDINKKPHEHVTFQVNKPIDWDNPDTLHKLPPVSKIRESLQTKSRRKRKKKSRRKRKGKMDTSASPEPPDENSPPSEIVGYVAEQLGESNKDLIEKVLQVAGPSRIFDILDSTLECEKNGGMMTVDGSRRRTVGGVFFQIVKFHSDFSPDEIKIVFSEEQRKKKVAVRRSKGVKKAIEATLSHLEPLLDIGEDGEIELDVDENDQIEFEVETEDPMAEPEHVFDGLDDEPTPSDVDKLASS